jgi:glycerol-3-phosphate acyltransferase PlsX
VVVTDGFTGNVCLKVSESLADMLIDLLREEISRSMSTRLAALLVRPAFRRLWKRVDYTETGGAPLLGINGACIISHGASPARAVKNAIRSAAEWVKADLNGHIRAALAGEVGQSVAEPRRGRSDDDPPQPDTPRRY